MTDSQKLTASAAACGDDRTPAEGENVSAALKSHRTLETTETGVTARFFTCDAPARLTLFRPADADGAWDERARSALEAARDACARYEGLFSRFLPDSDVARVSAAAGRPVAVAPETADVVAAGLRFCARSQGVFDLTIAPAAALWDFRRGIIPDPAALARACASIDWRRVTVGGSAADPWIRLEDPRAALDLGGIAKGWIADRVGAGFRQGGFADFLVNLGGAVLVAGAPGAPRPWTIGIRDPAARDAMAGFVRIAAGAAVTSGTTERSFVEGGVRYHHVLDPRSGRPVDTDATSVTVIAETALNAEGFSTTLLALGVNDGCAFAEAQPDIAQVIFIDRRGRFHASRI